MSNTRLGIETTLRDIELLPGRRITKAYQKTVHEDVNLDRPSMILEFDDGSTLEIVSQIDYKHKDPRRGMPNFTLTIPPKTEVEVVVNAAEVFAALKKDLANEIGDRIRDRLDVEVKRIIAEMPRS